MKREVKYIDVGGTKVRETNLWRTPRWLFLALAAEFGCDLDAAAREEDAHVDNYLGPDHQSPARRDALSIRWAPLCTAAFQNRPYKTPEGLLAWVVKMVEESTTIPVCALLPMTPSTEWFALAKATANEIRLFKSRVPCDRPDGTPSTQARGDLCVIVWLPNVHGPARFVYWDPPRRVEVAAVAPDHLIESEIPW